MAYLRNLFAIHLYRLNLALLNYTEDDSEEFVLL